MTLLSLIYEDAVIVVVDKPSGLLSVPGRGSENQDCVVSRIRERFPDCIKQPAVHRLDMDTSGLLLLALTRGAHRHLSIQFEQRQVKKRYVALLDGVITEEGGTIELPFRLDTDNRPRQVYDNVHGKIGITHWKNMGVEGRVTRVAFTPVTGRTHQLRVHAAHPLGLGIPIVGDRLYGNGTAPGQLKLHATHLYITHPETGEKLAFDSAPSFLVGSEKSIYHQRFMQSEKARTFTRTLTHKSLNRSTV